MATVAAHLGSPPPPPLRLPGRRATFSTGARRSATGRCRITRFSRLDSWTTKASMSGAEPSAGGDDASEVVDVLEVEPSNPGASFLAKVAVALGVAATVTAISIFMKQPSSVPSFSMPQIVDAYAQSDAATATIGYTFSLFGKKVIIPEYTPGWVYFWLLMAAGFGLFISEEALNVWVGISLSRTLCLDGTWQSLVNSFSMNASYIISTVLWVYWGVCISDMVPFYLGKLFRQTRASEDIYSKLGIGKEKALSVSHAVQKYGNLIGFVERFSIGVRNPTSFLAGAVGVSADCYFAGVCCGCLFTLPIQLALGFLLRERPVVALASVAAAVHAPFATRASGPCSLTQRRRARRCSSTSGNANPAGECSDPFCIQNGSFSHPTPHAWCLPTHPTDS
ncbi:uncharacterized protein LOC100833279 isoform X2 [Brachypodium distachyon]|uniref:uncharacterized protein LOC100833279 isoform X2 n=1 Tax=Brachypodium distachyon TaxID=15368 RepID=UPI000D0D822F|nr:uncharacterized protein LOC100833279 isoform X2 [Brachypodium distachyon]|eukprot:XP_024316767.1 uncharacterized protein LOC100833279 isoform X2 [Brachypodium distachyon]